MFTLHHGLWIYFITRRHKQVWQFVFGSMIPDYVYFLVVLYALKQGQLELSAIITLNPYVLMGMIPMYSWAVKADLIGHSVVAWGVVFLITLLPVLNRLQAIVIGWGSHLLLDGLTHGAYANYFLYPLSLYAVHSPVSYWEPNYLAKEFKIVNSILLSLITIYLVYKWRYKK